MNYNSYDNGYSNTSYGGGGGGGGGGFMAGGGSQNSPSAAKGPKDDTLRPVTIKQLNEAENAGDTDFKIDGTTVTQVTFVAQVRNISQQTTNVTYRLDDGTGVIEAKQWLDPDALDDGNKHKLSENGYVRVWGRLKSFGNKRHLSAHFIRPISDFNEISYHLLEATAVHLHFTQGPPGTGAAAGANGANGQQDTNMGGYGNNNAEGGGLPQSSSAIAKKVYECLRTTPQSNEGLHVEDISARLGMNTAEVSKGGDELLELGVIYTTVDDHTWAILSM